MRASRSNFWKSANSKNKQKIDFELNQSDINASRFKNGNWIIVATSVCTDRYVTLSYITPQNIWHVEEGGEWALDSHSAPSFCSILVPLVLSFRIKLVWGARSPPRARKRINQCERVGEWKVTTTERIRCSGRKEGRTETENIPRIDFLERNQLLDCCRLQIQFQEKSQQKDSRAPAGHLLENWGKCMACQFEATRSGANQITSVPLITIWLFL